MRLMRFVIVPRNGVEPDPNVDWYLKPPHIFLAGGRAHIRETASREARQLLEREKWQAARQHLDEAVIHYIVENGLYVKKRS